MNYRKGQQVAIAVHGAGVTSYEHHEVLRTSKGQVWVVDLSYPFDAETGEYSNDGMGLRLVLLDGEAGLPDEL